MLSFQGHPEMNEGLTKLMLQDVPTYICVDVAEKEALTRKMEIWYDGELI
jgi:hypothetical protein